MATDPSGIIANLLAGTGYGRTVSDYQQQNTQNQLGQQQLATGALQAAAAQQKLTQQARYQQWAQEYAQNPTPQKLGQGIAMFPDMADGLQKSYQVMTEPERISRVTQLSQIYNAAKSGRSDLASQQIDGIINAEKQQGVDTSEAEQVKAALASGDKDALTRLQAFAQAHLAAASPDFAKAIGITGNDKDSTHVINPGGALVDNSGRELYRANDAAPKYQVVKNANGSESIVQLGGGGQASGGGAAPASGAPSTISDVGSIWQNIVKREGGTNSDGSFRTSPKGAIGPAQLMPNTIATAAQLAGLDPKTVATDPNANLAAGQAYFQKQLSDFGDPALAAAAYNAGPGRVRQALAIAQSKGGNWLNYLPAETRAYVPAVTGGAPQSAGIKPIYTSQGGKPGYLILTPQEVSAIPGLDPQTVYQRSPTGEITAVGGQNKSQLKPLPPKALDVLSTNNASLTNINQAIDLLDPKNKSKDAQAARYSIGSSNYLIPNAILQHTDENGNQFRAQIGQIGGVIIKDISGAAVSASEDERLAKWVPSVTDSPSAALAKLKNLRREIMQRNGAVTDAYSEDQGYRPYSPGQQSQPSSGFRVLRVRPK